MDEPRHLSTVLVGLSVLYRSKMITKPRRSEARILLKRLGASALPFGKPLVDAPGILMDCFVMTVKVLQDLCTINGNTSHEDSADPLCGLRKQS